MVTIDVTRTRTVRERLSLNVDASEWERIFGTPLNPGTVTGLQVNEFFDALGAKPQVLTTDIDSDVYSYATVGCTDRPTDEVSVARYEYDRARVAVSEALAELHRLARAHEFAQLEYNDAEQLEEHRINNLSFVETLTTNG